MKAVAIVIFAFLFVLHAGFTTYLATQHFQLLATVASQNAALSQALDASKKEQSDALAKFKGDLSDLLKPFAAQVDDIQALAAMGAGYTVGCDGSKFKIGTLGEAAHRAYVKSGACNSQPDKRRGRDE